MILFIYSFATLIVILCAAAYFSRLGDEPAEIGFYALTIGILWPLTPLFVLMWLVAYAVGLIGKFLYGLHREITNV